MQWSEFVEGCEEWSDEKILKNIGRIESFGQAEEVKGILDYIPNGYRDFFVQKALDAGVKLSIYDIADLEEYISRDMMRRLLDPIIEKKRVFSEKEMNELKELFSDESNTYILQKSLENGAVYSKKFIMDIINYINTDMIDILINKSLDNGIEYSVADIDELYGCITDKTTKLLIEKLQNRKTTFTFDELMQVCVNLDEQEFSAMVRKSMENGAIYNKDQIMELADFTDEKTLVALIKHAHKNGIKYRKKDIEDICLIDEKLHSELMKLVTDGGEKYTYEDIAEGSAWFSIKTTNRIIESSIKDGTEYTRDQIMNIYELLEPDVVGTMVKKAMKNGEEFSRQDIEDLQRNVDKGTLHTMVRALVERVERLSYDDVRYLVDYIDDDQKSDLLKIIIKKGGTFSYEQLNNLDLTDTLQEEALGKLVLESIKAREEYRVCDIIELMEYLDNDVIYRALILLAKAGTEISYDELMQVAEEFREEQISTLILESIHGGASYTVEELIGFGSYVGETTLVKVIKYTDLPYTKEEMRSLQKVISIEALMKIDEERGTHYFDPEPWEIIDAVRDANAAISYLAAAQSCYVDAKDMGAAGMLSRKGIFGLLKYANIAEAQDEIDMAAHYLQDFANDVKSMKLRFDISTSLTAIDMFTDSLLADHLVQRKIKKAIRECRSVIYSVEDIRDKLIDMLPEEYKK